MRELALVLHIVAGSVALLSGLGAAGVKVVGLDHRLHVLSGRTYAAAMMVVAGTALPLAVWTRSLFLGLVGVFSLYLVTAGWRYATHRRGPARWVDWISSGAMAAVASIMVLYGLWSLRSGPALVLVVFGLIGGALSAGDLKNARRGGPYGQARIARHLTMMLAGLIATITAVLVTNVSFEPAVVLWLAPTVVISPLIAWMNRRVRRRSRASGAGAPPASRSGSARRAR